VMREFDLRPNAAALAQLFNREAWL